MEQVHCVSILSDKLKEHERVYYALVECYKQDKGARTGRWVNVG
jgi:hypothetical protein